MEAVWWFLNDEPMNLASVDLHDDYTVKQVGGVGDHCWRISGIRPNVSMNEAIVRMRVVYPRANRTMNGDLLPVYLESMRRRAA
jgi:hypothetical protein